MAVFEAAPNIFGIDLFEEDRPGRSSAYVILGKEPVLIETGSQKSHDALVMGLVELGVMPEDLRHIIVTHVHLDHAGGVGQMMARAPEALLHCHPRARRHVIDPSRLGAGARKVYGDKVDDIFGPLVPVEEDRVVPQEDGSALEVGDRTLVFYDTPGHARHHTCVVDQITQGLFSGDTVGIRYVPSYTGWNFVYGFPTTSPSDFDPDVMLTTLDRLQELDLTRVYHTHFGVTHPAAAAFDFSRRGTEAVARLIEQVSPAPSLGEVHEALSRVVKDDLSLCGHTVDNVAPLGVDIWLNSQGIFVYLQKQSSGEVKN